MKMKWLRKKNDFNHINVDELDVVLKGINLASRWSLKKIEIRTYSDTVLSWINSVITLKNKVQSKEMIIERQLGILGELIV